MFLCVCVCFWVWCMPEHERLCLRGCVCMCVALRTDRPPEKNHSTCAFDTHCMYSKKNAFPENDQMEKALAPAWLLVVSTADLEKIKEEDTENGMIKTETDKRRKGAPVAL